MRVVWSATKDPFGTPVSIGDITEGTINVGRRRVSDKFTDNVCVLRGRDIASLPALALDDVVEVELKDPSNNLSLRTFYGVITEIRQDYGIVANADVWEITLNAGLTSLARAVLGSQSFTDGDTLFEAISNDYILALPYGSAGATLFNVPSSRVTGVNLNGLNAQDVFIKLANSAASLYASATNFGTSFSVAFSGPYFEPNAGLVFTDAGVGGALPPIAYDRVSFTSTTQNLATAVKVESEGGFSVTQGTTGQTETFKTYSYNTAEASDLANVYELLFSDVSAVPFEVSFLFSTQPSDLTFYCGSPAEWCQVVLRGTTYDSVILGYTMSGTPSDTRQTTYLAPASIMNYLILDNTNWGVLDKDRLGF